MPNGVCRTCAIPASWLDVQNVRLSVAAKLGEGCLLQVRQDIVEPTAGLLDVIAAVGVGRPVIAPTAGRKTPRYVLKVQHGQSKLLQVVLALDQPCRLAGRLHRREQQRDQDADDRDDDQKFDQGKTTLGSLTR